MCDWKNNIENVLQDTPKDVVGNQTITTRLDPDFNVCVVNKLHAALYAVKQR